MLNSPLRPAVVGAFVNGDPNAKEQVNKAHQEIIGDLKVYDVEYAGGCLNLYDPRIFEDFGFFPEYPLFGVEDGGLCRAVRAAARHVVVVDNVKVGHMG